MSRTEPRGALNLSSSSMSVSSDMSEEEEGSGSDVEIEKILSEVRGFPMLDVLPPTPQRPSTRSQSRCSVASAVSSVFTSSRQSETVSPSKSLNASPSKLSTCGSSKGGYNAESKKDRRARRKRTEKEILKGLGIDLDEEELEQMEKDDRVPVDNVIDDIIDMSLGKKRVKGGVKTVTMEDEKLDRQFQKLRKRAPLEINGDGRCAALKEDVTTIRGTLEKVNALIFVLEKARDKLVDEDNNLEYTQPPVKTKKNPVRTEKRGK